MSNGKWKFYKIMLYYCCQHKTISINLKGLEDMGTIWWPLACCFWTYKIAYFFKTYF